MIECNKDAKIVKNIYMENCKLLQNQQSLENCCLLLRQIIISDARNIICQMCVIH